MSDDLALRIRDEADIASRPGQYDRLMKIADDLRVHDAEVRAEERERCARIVKAAFTATPHRAAEIAERIREGNTK